VHLRLDGAPRVAVLGRCYLSASGSGSQWIARFHGHGGQKRPQIKINSSVTLM